MLIFSMITVPYGRTENLPAGRMSQVKWHVLLAEFDIDVGSVVREQYPEECDVLEQ